MADDRVVGFGNGEPAGGLDRKLRSLLQVRPADGTGHLARSQGQGPLQTEDPEIGIGGVLLARLIRRHVNVFGDKFPTSGHSEHLTRCTLSVLMLVLNDAIDTGHLFTNPAKGVRGIRSSRIERGFLIKEMLTVAAYSSERMTVERNDHLFPSPDHQKAMALVGKQVFR